MLIVISERPVQCAPKPAHGDNLTSATRYVTCTSYNFSIVPRYKLFVWCGLGAVQRTKFQDNGEEVKPLSKTLLVIDYLPGQCLHTLHGVTTTKEEAPQWRRRGAGHDEGGGGVLQTCHSAARRAGVVPRRWPRAVRPAVDLPRQ